jgi:hypothetical protein
MKIVIDGFIHASIPESWEFDCAEVINGVKYEFWLHSDLTCAGKTLVTPHQICFELPDKFDATKGFVEVLQRKKARLMAAHNVELLDVDKKIQQLLAINCEVAP